MAPPPATPPAPPRPSTVAAWSIVACLALVGAYLFPRFWYTRSNHAIAGVWFHVVTNSPGWSYRPQPIGSSEERQLAADLLQFGTYQRKGADDIRLFTAARTNENPNLLGLFVHTPDFCWSQVGWKLELDDRDVVSFDLHGVPLQVERRVFRAPNGHRELVYFFGLVGGQPLPYRLDHNFAIARRSVVTTAAVRGGAGIAGTDSRLWRRIFDAFLERRPLLGPKQFVRISTEFVPQREPSADSILQNALTQFLQPSAALPGSPASTPLAGTR